MTPSCIFCQIERGDIASDLLYRDELIFVVRDVSPKAVVHLLLIPVKHVISLSELYNADLGFEKQLFSVATSISKQMGVDGSGYRLVLNQGPDSGQQIDHLHFHLLGGNQLSDIG